MSFPGVGGGSGGFNASWSWDFSTAGSSTTTTSSTWNLPTTGAAADSSSSGRDLSMPPPPPTLVLEDGQARAIMNPLATTQPQFDELIQRLEDTENLQSNFFGIVNSNHHIYRMLRGFTISRRYSSLDCARAEQREMSLLGPFVLLIAVIFRIFSSSIYIFPIAAISLLALQAGITNSFWEVLVKLRVIYDKRLTVKIAQALGQRKRDNYPPGSSTKIIQVVGDNCAYTIRSEHEHADEDRTRCYYETINWFLRPVSNEHDQEVDAGRPKANQYF